RGRPAARGPARAGRRRPDPCGHAPARERGSIAGPGRGAAAARGGRAPGAGRGFRRGLAHAPLLRAGGVALVPPASRPRHDGALSCPHAPSSPTPPPPPSRCFLCRVPTGATRGGVGPRPRGGGGLPQRTPPPPPPRAGMSETLTRLYGTTTFVSKEQAWKEFS